MLFKFGVNMIYDFSVGNSSVGIFLLSRETVQYVVQLKKIHRVFRRASAVAHTLFDNEMFMK